MNRDQDAGLYREWLLWAGLLLVGLASRELLVEWPNFKPVNAVCVLGGLLLSRWWLAGLLPLVLLSISDWRLGGSMPLLALAVLVALWMNAAGFRLARKWLSTTSANPYGLLVPAVIGATCLGSIQFYLTTSLAVWACSGWYVVDAAGLGQCLLAGLPFFWKTLAGDAVFLAAPLVLCLLSQRAWHLCVTPAADSW